MADAFSIGASGAPSTVSPLEMQIQQQAIERQRTIATLLQQQGMTAPEGQMISGHYVAPSSMSYISKIGQALIGKSQQSVLDNKQMGLARQYDERQLALAKYLVKGSEADPASPVASSSEVPAMPSFGQSSTSDAPNMPLGSGMTGLNTRDGMPGGISPLSAGGFQGLPPTASTAGMPITTTPTANAPRSGGNPIFRGIDPVLVSQYIQSPESAFGKIVQMQMQANSKAMEPTDLIKTMRAAGIDENSTLGKQLLQANIAKSNHIAPTSLRPGGYVQNADGSRQQLPQVPEGFQAVEDGTGGWKIVPVQGGKEAIASTSTSKARGPATFNTQKVWNPQTGQYELQTAATVSDALTTPAPGGKVTESNIRNVAGLGANGYAGSDQNPQPTASDIAQLDKEIAKATNPMTKNLLTQYKSQLLASTGGATKSSPFAAEPAPGYTEGQKGLAKGGVDRFNDTVKQAQESPARVNIYDNVLELSKQGVATGPGQDWKNKVKGYVANTPGLEGVAASWKGDVGGYTELQKFLKQNYLRSWQAAGGTGTDAQMGSFEKANPNDTMFPKALQAMAQFGKAGELALQAKTAAQDAWLQNNGRNVASQDKFESQWRQTFDPRIFQLQVMPPEEQKSFIGKLSPQDAKTLLQKRSAIKKIGGF